MKQLTVYGNHIIICQLHTISKHERIKSVKVF